MVDYQDGKLVMRKYEPGKQCVWNKKQYYCQYANKYGTELHNGSVPGNLLPQHIRFWKKHPNIPFPDYDAAVNDYDFSVKQTKFTATKEAQVLLTINAMK